MGALKNSPEQVVIPLSAGVLAVLANYMADVYPKPHWIWVTTTTIFAVRFATSLPTHFAKILCVVTSPLTGTLLWYWGNISNSSNETTVWIAGSILYPMTALTIVSLVQLLFGRRPDVRKPKGPSGSKTNVFVIYGRDIKLRDSMFSLLRSLGLNPIEWEEMRSNTGKPSPYIGEILDSGLSMAAAVVAILSPDDLACLRPSLLRTDDGEVERKPTGQARANVLFETGLAFGRLPEHTIIIRVGNVRPFSDVAGLHIVDFDGSAKSRQVLKQRLLDAKCDLKESGTDWLNVGDFNTTASADPDNCVTFEITVTPGNRHLDVQPVLENNATNTPTELTRPYRA